MKINANSMITHQTLIDINANNIANVNTQNFKRDETFIGDRLEVSSYKTNEESNLAKDMTNQIIIKNGFKAQAAPIKTQDEMTKTLLDIKA